MQALLSTKSEELPAVDWPREQPIPAPITLCAGQGAPVRGDFLKILQASPRYMFVEAVQEGSFSWVFSRAGDVTGVRVVRLLAGQRAQAYASRSQEQVGLQLA